MNEYLKGEEHGILRESVELPVLGLSPDAPLLNIVDEYVPENPRTKDDDEDMVFDTNAFIYSRRTHLKREEYDQIFNATMNYFTKNERATFRKVQTGQTSPQEFLRDMANYLRRNFPQMQDNNDFNVMMERLEIASLRYYVLQPLIDNPQTSDIKICAPDDIRVRVKGKAYQSNATFIDEDDLWRFVDAIILRNRIVIGEHPVITFTDNHDENYILRFTVSFPSINAVSHPYLHIRKVPKSKPDFDDLIKADMLDEKIKAYLIDRAKHSHGIAFAGPPGSGKSTILNAWIEFIPRTRETLVIQENDELFTHRTGFMFKHVSHGFQGEPVCTLEDLGKMALVEGCNQFIIGEAKGAEMRSIMTLLNSGGYGALTLHSNSVYQIVEKMADLVKYGSSYTFEEAKRMLKAFDTLVYMEGYKVRDIVEIVDYDEIKKDFIYRHIYHREFNKAA